MTLSLLLALLAVGAADLPVASWTQHFAELEQAGEWRTLATELGALRAGQPDDYQRCSLGYLQGRALLETGQWAAARTALEPYLAAGAPLRDLALYHSARAAEALGDTEAVRSLREELIFHAPGARYRAAAIEAEVARLYQARDAEGLRAFSLRLSAVGEPASREIASRLVELFLGTEPETQIARGLALLREKSGDDPAERVLLALDRPEIVKRLDPEAWRLLGESALQQRRFPRALALLALAQPQLPAKREQIVFSIGRAHYWAEDYAAAEKVYLDAVRGTAKAETRAVLLYHAARCAQLQGDDKRAEQQLGSAITVGGLTPKTANAINQRLRLRLRQQRFAEAARDLLLLKQRFPRQRALYEGSLAYALAMLAAGKEPLALTTLNGLPSRVVRHSDAPEMDYWRGRALERSDPAAALGYYLRVLQGSTPFASFARARAFAPGMAQPLAVLQTQLQEAAAQSNKDDQRAAAWTAEADRYRLTPPNELRATGWRPPLLDRLAGLCREVASCREVADLAPLALPRFPLTGPVDRLDLLLAMGLADDALELFPARYSLNPPAAALTRSSLLALAGQRNRSVQAAELALSSAPPGMLSALWPPAVEQLLYPRAFQDLVQASASRYGTDPALLFSVMREESRFEPRARSGAAARGLVQLVLDTAASVARSLGRPEIGSDQLYQPAVALDLGARYLADLQWRFGGDREAVVAAYNAGPNQAALWLRMAPAPGDDYFLSSVTFDETKEYLVKVLRSYRHYRPE